MKKNTHTQSTSSWWGSKKAEEDYSRGCQQVFETNKEHDNKYKRLEGVTHALLSCESRILNTRSRLDLTTTSSFLNYGEYHFRNDYSEQYKFKKSEMDEINAHFELYVTIDQEYDYFMETEKTPKSKALICMHVGKLTIIYTNTQSEVEFISGVACPIPLDTPHLTLLKNFLSHSGYRRRLRQDRWMFVTSIRTPTREPIKASTKCDSSIELSSKGQELDCTQENLELFRKSVLVKLTSTEFLAVQKMCQETFDKNVLTLSLEIKSLPVLITFDKYPYISAKDLWTAVCDKVQSMLITPDSDPTPRKGGGHCGTHT